MSILWFNKRHLYCHNTALQQIFTSFSILIIIACTGIMNKWIWFLVCIKNRSNQIKIKFSIGAHWKIWLLIYHLRGRGSGWEPYLDGMGKNIFNVTLLIFSYSLRLNLVHWWSCMLMIKRSTSVHTHTHSCLCFRIPRKKMC